MKAAFLTPEDVGEGFKGEPPTKESKNVGGKDPKPLCGVKLPESQFHYSVLYTKAGTTQAFEGISVFKPGDSERFVAQRRAQAEARCGFDEAVGELKYHVKIEGPIPNFPSFGDESTSTVHTFTGDYQGTRHAMTARIGLAAVYMEYTAPELDEEVALSVFRKAMEKAEALR